MLSVAQMREAEKAALARGITADALMDEAGGGVARFIQKMFPQPSRCLVFAGKGNNGGDAVVAGTALKRAGWHVEIHLTGDSAGELLKKKLAAFRVAAATERPASSALIVIDGLLGIGSKPPLRDPVRGACRAINSLRRDLNAFVFALDLPSGLDADNGDADADAVVADFTVTIGAAKRGLLIDDAINFVGRLEVVALGDLRFDVADEVVATPASLRALLPRRKFSSYKNEFGRVGVVAGSRGLVGAAAMCARGALRGGAGLVEVFVPEEIYSLVVAIAPPEAMVKPIQSYAELREVEVDAWAIGPGLGQEHAKELRAFLRKLDKPTVLDADALNIVSADVHLLEKIKAPLLLTPHPGEIKRLGGAMKKSRAKIARKFVSDYPVTLLLKGSRTIVAEGRELSYNTAGNPGMATGGMGDLLTGVCAALLGQKLSPYDAARVGAWVCGRAAEIALFNGGASEQSLLPSDLAETLGRAFRDLQSL